MSKLSYLSSFCLALILIGCTTNKEQILTIAASANMRPVMEKIVPAFEKSNDLACDLIIGSSGKIAAQIEQGAPFDIFLSADNKYPTSIYESDLAIGPPEIYAFGKLVLWTLERDSHLDTDFLLSGKTQYISIANPITAPYGLAAESFLKASGIYLDKFERPWHMDTIG
jgi:molybdate transport system substrate-binding protein